MIPFHHRALPQIEDSNLAQRGLTVRRRRLDDSSGLVEQVGVDSNRLGAILTPTGRASRVLNADAFGEPTQP